MSCALSICGVGMFELHNNGSLACKIVWMGGWGICNEYSCTCIIVMIIAAAIFNKKYNSTRAYSYVASYLEAIVHTRREGS